MDAKQLAQIELAMAEDHRRDKEALERLKRFIHGDNGQNTNRIVSFAPSTFVDDDADGGSESTIRNKVAEVFGADSTRRWTIPQMVEHLQSVDFPLKAKKPEATMYGVFNALRGRGIIRLVRRGTGRNPNTYRLVTAERENGAASEESTRVTLSPTAQKLTTFLRSSGGSPFTLFSTTLFLIGLQSHKSMD